MEHSKKNIKSLTKESSGDHDDTTILIKLTVQILSQLKEMETRLVVQEELLLNFRKQSIIQKASEQFEPIRGIHGLAEFLGVSPVTAQKLKNSGKIPYAQYERLVLFDPKRVMDALESINKPRK